MGDVMTKFAWAGMTLACLTSSSAIAAPEVRDVPTSVTAVVMLSEVVFAALSAVLLGGEELALRTVVGGALIVAASAMSAFSRRD